MGKCQYPECKEESTLKCPTCDKIGLPEAYYCGPDHFKKHWPMHKTIHGSADPVWAKKFEFTGSLRPALRQAAYKLQLPKEIPKPDYYDSDSGTPFSEISIGKKSIPTNTPEQIENIREACKFGRYLLDKCNEHSKPGVTTESIDNMVYELCVQNGVYPSPLNYNKFPKSLCTSINEVICHGIPDSRILVEGDILNCDISVFMKGVHADLNETFTIGEVDQKSKDLIEGTYSTLHKAIQICKPGVMYRECGNIIEEEAKKWGLQVVRRYIGHGVGQFFHSLPNVPHYAKNKTPGKMQVGHTFTIEPMINQGTYDLIHWEDDWTAVTMDGKRSAQFEHTLLITEDGCEVLTKRLDTSPKLCFDESKYPYN